MCLPRHRGSSCVCLMSFFMFVRGWAVIEDPPRCHSLVAPPLRMMRAPIGFPGPGTCSTASCNWRSRERLRAHLGCGAPSHLPALTVQCPRRVCSLGGHRRRPRRDDRRRAARGARGAGRAMGGQRARGCVGEAGWSAGGDAAVVQSPSGSLALELGTHRRQERPRHPSCIVCGGRCRGRPPILPHIVGMRGAKQSGVEEPRGRVCPTRAPRTSRASSA